jgi:hypothetical protein
MFDINGLLEDTRTDLVDFQKPYSHRHAPTRDFVAAIESIKPTRNKRNWSMRILTSIKKLASPKP